MPAKEISLNDLKVSGAAGTVLHKSLTENKEYTGRSQSVPAGVKGEASLTTVKVMASEKGPETWIMINATAVVTSPAEYRGRQVYPGYTFGKTTLSDEEKVGDTVRGVIRFMNNLGIPEAAINKAKEAKAADFFYVAVKTIEAYCGKNAANFKFTTRPQKKDPTRTECLANGPASPDNSGAPAVPDTGSGVPSVGETWLYQELECRVTAVNTTPNQETVDLEPLDGSAPFTGVAWFTPEGAQQISYVRA